MTAFTPRGYLGDISFPSLYQTAFRVLKYASLLQDEKFSKNYSLLLDNEMDLAELIIPGCFPWCMTSHPCYIPGHEYKGCFLFAVPQSQLLSRD